MVSRYMVLEDDHYLVKVEIKESQQGTRLNQMMDHVAEVKTILHKRGTDIQYSLRP